MFLLDSNVCIAALNQSSASLIQRLREQPATAIRLCSITKAELLYGARHSARVAENLRVLERFFAPFVCLPFDDPCAEQCALVREELARRGEQIGPNDLLIAAVARAHELTLVTHNLGEFSRVAGLRLADWEEE